MWKALGLYLDKLQINDKFAKIQILLLNLVIKQKMCKRKIAQIARNYTFVTQQIQMCKNICKIFKT